MPLDPFLAVFQLIFHLCPGITPGQRQLEIGGPEWGKGFDVELLEACLALAHAAGYIQLALGAQRALAVESGSQLVGGEVSCGCAQSLQLQRQFIELERGHPVGFALLALIQIGKLAIGQRNPCDIDNNGSGFRFRLC